MSSLKIPYSSFGGRGKVLHFAHANGYPTGCYRQLLELFQSDYQVIGMTQRPLWPGYLPHSIGSWDVLAEDLIRFFDQEGVRGVTGVGHSLGAIVSLIAAVRRPELFRSLVLIEPVILPRRLYLLKYLIPRFLREFVIPPARAGRNRRNRWGSKQEVFDDFRSKRVFGGISDSVLWDYVNAGTQEMGNGERGLAFSREWEVYIYTLMTNPWDLLKRVKVPVLALRGELSDTIRESAWEDFKVHCPDMTFVNVKGAGHLLPFEQPKRVGAEIRKFLEALPAGI